MTEYTNNNKFVLSTPKTYEVRYLEVKEPSKISQIASYLGIKTVENCSTCGVSDKTFQLNMDLRNCTGDHLYGSANNTREAMSEAALILQGNKHWEGGKDGKGCFTKGNRENLVSKVNTEIAKHIKGEGEAVIKMVHND